MLETLLGSRTAELRHLLDNPGVSLNDPAAYDFLTNNSATDAGINVSPKSVMRLPPVWQAVTMISGDVACLPIDLYLKKGRGRETIENHPAKRFVHDFSSKNVTSLDCWQTAMVHALVWNNGYVYVDRLNNGSINGLYNLLPDRTAPELIKGELYFVTETQKQDGSPWLRPIPAANVIHIKGISFDGLVGLDLVESAKHSWALAIAHQKFEAKLFKNGVRAGGILELPAEMKGKVADKVEEGFKKQTGEDAWFKTVILRDGAKFHQQTFDPQSSQMVELGEAKVRDIARWFNLAPSRLGISDSVSYNSKSEDNRSYLDSTLNVWLQKIVAQCSLRLLTEEERAAGYYFEHNTDKLLRMSMKDRYAAWRLGFGLWLNRNDVREFENLPDTGPDGDKFTPTPDSGLPPTTGGADKGPNDKPRGPGKPKRSRRVDANTIAIRRLVFTMTDHARKKSSNPKAFVEFVDSDLSFHRQRSANVTHAERWIDRAVTELKSVAEKTAAGDLAAAVDASMTALEMSCP